MSYHFVAAAGEASEAPDRHLKAATLGHDVGPVHKLLKAQKTRARWCEDGVERGVNIGRCFDECPPDSSEAALYKCLTVTWHVIPLISLPPTLSHPLWVSSLLFNWDSRWDVSIFQRCVLLSVWTTFILIVAFMDVKQTEQLQVPTGSEKPKLVELKHLNF